MTGNALRLIFTLAALVIAITRTHSWADDNSQADVASQMRGLISAIGDERAEQKQEELARQLLIYIKYNSENVDQSMIIDMTHLLGDEDSATRNFILISMKYVANKAVVVMPVLEKLLHATECHVKEASSVPTLRDLLERMGAKVDRRPDCRGR